MHSYPLQGRHELAKVFVDQETESGTRHESDGDTWLSHNGMQAGNQSPVLYVWQLDMARVFSCGLFRPQLNTRSMCVNHIRRHVCWKRLVSVKGGVPVSHLRTESRMRHISLTLQQQLCAHARESDDLQHTATFMWQLVRDTTRCLLQWKPPTVRYFQLFSP